MTRLGYFDGRHVKNNVINFLDEHAERNPERIALRWVDGGELHRWSHALADPLAHRSLSLGNFYDAICRVSAGLTELGLERGDRVILFLPMSVGLYAAMFGIVRLGAIPVFLDSWARRTHLGISAEQVGPRAMISFQQAFDLCADVPQLAGLPIRIVAGPITSTGYTAALEELMRFPKHGPVAAVEREDTALVTFTTGSSGVPKGANRTHRFLAAQHYALAQCIPYEAADVDLPAFPIFSLNNIASGVSTVIPAIDLGVPKETDSLLLFAQLHETACSCSTLSPSMLDNLAAFCRARDLLMPGLRRVITGGAPISRDNLVGFTGVARNAQVWVLYGSTEVEPMAHIEAQEMIGFRSRAAEDAEWVDDGVNVGHFADGLRYRFIHIQKGPVVITVAADWEQLEVAPGAVGELVVAGEHVCRDYFNNPGAFSRAKITDVDGTIWHRTGDLARLDAEGYLWIVGRVHNAINRGGTYVFPVRAEVVMKKLPFVAQCAYLGIPHPDLGEETACVIAPREVGRLAECAMENEVRRILAKNETPVDRVFFVEEIPMDPRHHSKVEYEVLRRQLHERRLI